MSILMKVEVTLNWDKNKEEYTWEIHGQAF